MAQQILVNGDIDVTADIQSAYIKVEDVKAGPLSVRIKNVVLEHFDARANLPARDAKVAILDGEPEQKLALNKTNLKTLAAAYGPKVSAWVGRDIDLYLGNVSGRDFVRVVIPPPPTVRRGVRQVPEPEAVTPSDDVAFAFGANVGDVEKF